MPFLDVWSNNKKCKITYFFEYEHFLIDTNHIFCFLFSEIGTCWPSFWWLACVELILGCTRFIIQIFWNYSCWSSPQCHPSWCKDQLDLQICTKTSWIARSYISWQKLTWSWQRLPLHSNHWWFTPCSMAPQKSSPLTQKALSNFIVNTFISYSIVFFIRTRFLFVYLKFAIE